MTRSAAGTIIAFDFGLRRIGVAVGERMTGTCSPLTTVHCGGGVDWDAIGRLLDEWRPSLLVVGQPRHADGSESPMSQQAARFAGELTQRFGVEAVLVDERLSSAEAADRLSEARQQGRRRRRRVGRGDIDPVAAQVILETWMSGRTGPDNEHGHRGNER